MAKSIDTVWKIEEHTKAKHRILRGYLDAWLPIMSKHNGRLVYIDGFAGPGVYTGGEPGSPIIALKAYLEHKHRSHITAEIVYFFIDEDPKRIAQLREEVQKLGLLPDKAKVSIREGAYEQVFGEILDGVEQRGARLAPTFAFIDPFGYKTASMQLSGRFLQFDRCEVLVYVPFPFIARFVTTPAVEPALTNLFGSEEWKEARAVGGKARLRVLHDLFQRRLKEECGLEYVRSFQIVKGESHTGYHLFFGTKNKIGLLKMKEAMWRIDPVEGQRFIDSTEAAQQTLFQPEPDFAGLRRAMEVHFGNAPFSIEDGEDFTLTETAFLPSHVRTVLRPLEDGGQLEIVWAKPGRKRRQYPPGTRMRFVP